MAVIVRPSQPETSFQSLSVGGSWFANGARWLPATAVMKPGAWRLAGAASGPDRRGDPQGAQNKQHGQMGRCDLECAPAEVGIAAAVELPDEETMELAQI